MCWDNSSQWHFIVLPRGKNYNERLISSMTQTDTKLVKSKISPSKRLQRRCLYARIVIGPVYLAAHVDTLVRWGDFTHVSIRAPVQYQRWWVCRIALFIKNLILSSPAPPHPRKKNNARKRDLLSAYAGRASVSSVDLLPPCRRIFPPPMFTLIIITNVLLGVVRAPALIRSPISTHHTNNKKCAT